MELRKALRELSQEHGNYAMRIAALNLLMTAPNSDRRVRDIHQAEDAVITHVDALTDAYDNDMAEWQEYGQTTDPAPKGMIGDMHIYDIRTRLQLPMSRRQASLAFTSTDRDIDTTSPDTPVR